MLLTILKVNRTETVPGKDGEEPKQLAEIFYAGWVDHVHVRTGKTIHKLFSALSRDFNEADRGKEKITVECPATYRGKENLLFTVDEKNELEGELTPRGLKLPEFASG